MLTKRSRQLASVLALLAATLAVSSPARADDSPGIEIEAQRCIESTQSRHVSALDCPEFFELLVLDSGWLATDLAASDTIAREDLHDLYRLSTPQSLQRSRWKDAEDALDSILVDYKDLKNQDPKAIEKFFEWLAEKFDNSAFAKRVADFSSNFRLAPDTLRYVFYAMLAALAAAALLALVVLVRTVFLNISPRGLYGTDNNPRIDTGDERGNAPILSLTEIRDLPAAQQPAALLVAAVDYFRGTLLPDNPWAATNAEISRTVSAGDQTMVPALDTLISNAERTLYGEKPVTSDQIDASFKAATTILGSRGPSALAEPGA